MKRYEFKRLITMVCLTMFCFTSITANAISFPDTKNHWASYWINGFSDNNYIGGYTDGLFKPDKQITREEAALIFSRFVDLKASNEVVFSDVSQDRFSYNAIQSVAKMGIMNGYSNSEFLPENNLTREEAIKAIALSIEKVNGYTPDVSNATLNFKDNKTIDDWALDYAKQLIAYGTLEGYPDGTVRGKDYITRAEFVKLFYKNIQKLENYIVSGSLIGIADRQGIRVEYSLNGVQGNVVTNTAGFYSITVPKDASLVITAPSRSGYDVSPKNYTIDAVTTNLMRKDFTYKKSGSGGNGSNVLQSLSWSVEYYVDDLTPGHLIDTLPMPNVDYGTFVNLTTAQLNACKPEYYPTGLLVDDPVSITVDGQIVKVLYKLLPTNITVNHHVESSYQSDVYSYNQTTYKTSYVGVLINLVTYSINVGDNYSYNSIKTPAQHLVVGDDVIDIYYKLIIH